jgi:hypothetical protein
MVFSTRVPGILNAPKLAMELGADTDRKWLSKNTTAVFFVLICFLRPKFMLDEIKLFKHLLWLIFFVQKSFSSKANVWYATKTASTALLFTIFIILLFLALALVQYIFEDHWFSSFKRTTHIMNINKAEVDRIFNCPKDEGDRQKGYRILNMHATPTRPSPQLPPEPQFLAHINIILFRLRPHRFVNERPAQQARLVKRANIAVRKVIGALLVVADYQNKLWNPDRVILVDEFDRRIEATPWAILQAHHGPMDEQAFAAHIMALPPVPPNPHRSLNGPSRRELVEEDRERQDCWDDEESVVRWNENDPDAPRGNRQNKPWHERVLPNRVLLEVLPTLGDGQCFWYSIAQAMWGDWKRYALIKANIQKFFMYVLTTPTHPRYRMYCHLQAESIERSKTWGETSLARCLHVNAYQGSWPQHRPPYNLGLNQLIADYFDIEYIEFAQPGRDAKYNPDIPGLHGSNSRRWHPRARGRDGAPQVFQFREDLNALHGTSSHLTYQQQTQNYQHVFRTNNHRHHVDMMPWHPGLNRRLRATHLPRNLGPADHTWANVAMRATVAEITQLRAGIDTPGLMPRIPGYDTRIAWHEEVPQIPDPVLGFHPYLAADGPVTLPYHSTKEFNAWQAAKIRKHYRRKSVHKWRWGLLALFLAANSSGVNKDSGLVRVFCSNWDFGSRSHFLVLSLGYNVRLVLNCCIKLALKRHDSLELDLEQITCGAKMLHPGQCSLREFVTDKVIALPSIP